MDKQLNSILVWLKNNWAAICLLLSLAVSLVLSVIGMFSNTIKNDWYILFFNLAGASLVFVLLDIRLFLNNAEEWAKSVIYFKGMNAAQASIFDKISKHMNSNKNDSVKLRVYGMRLSGVHRLLVELMTELTRHNTNTRKLDIHVYCCAPEFLRSMKPYNLNNEQTTHFNNLLNSHINNMENNINELKIRIETIDVIDIQFKKYNSIPSFWAFEIDSEDIFWGYTWDNNELNWIGPQNQCCYFNKKNQPLNGMFGWIQNQINGLETWSVPYS